MTIAISSATIGITSLVAPPLWLQLQLIFNNYPIYQAQQSLFNSYIDDQGNDIGLSTANINTIKDWYNIIAYAFIVLSVVQVERL